MQARKIILAVGAVLLMATGKGFGYIEFKDGGTYNINYLTPDDVRVDYQAPGMQTTVNVLDGGGITTPSHQYWGILEAHSDSRINISGGYVDRLDAYNSTTVNLSGGNISRLNAWNSTTVNILPGALVNGPVLIRDNSSVVISSGFFAGSLVAYDTSSVAITGGNFRDDHATYLIASESSTVDISGGFVNMLRPNDTSRVDISGGMVGQLSASGASEIRFYGYDFTGTGSISFDGNKVLGTGELCGRWLDGTAWTTNINVHNTGATILALPEPATLSLLALGGLAVLRRRQK